MLETTPNKKSLDLRPLHAKNLWRADGLYLLSIGKRLRHVHTSHVTVDNAQ